MLVKLILLAPCHTSSITRSAKCLFRIFRACCARSIFATTTAWFSLASTGTRFVKVNHCQLFDDLVSTGKH